MANFTFPKDQNLRQQIICLNPSDLDTLIEQEKTPLILEASSDIHIVSPHSSEFELMFNNKLREFIHTYQPQVGEVYILDNGKYTNIQSLNYYNSDLNLIRSLTNFCQILGAKYLHYKSTSYQDFSASLGLDIHTKGLLKKLIDPSASIDFSKENTLKKDFEKTTQWIGHSKEEIIINEANSIINSLRKEDQPLFKHILEQRLKINSITVMKEKLVMSRKQKTNLKIIAELAIKLPTDSPHKNNSLFKLKNSIVGSLTNIFEHTIELELKF